MLTGRPLGLFIGLCCIDVDPRLLYSGQVPAHTVVAGRYVVVLSFTPSPFHRTTVNDFDRAFAAAITMSAPTELLDPALYESRAYIPTTVVSVVLSLATLTVGLRCYARAVLIRQFGIDDWAILVALVLAMGSGIMVASSGFTNVDCPHLSKKLH